MRGIGALLLVVTACVPEAPRSVAPASIDAARELALVADAGLAHGSAVDAAPGEPLDDVIEDPRMAEGLARFPSFARALAQVRRLGPYTLRVDPVSRRRLRELCRASLDHELPPPRRELLAHLGFVASPEELVVDYERIAFDSGGLTDVRDGRVYVFDSARLDPALAVIEARQLSLRRGLFDAARLSNDEVDARGLVATGELLLLALVWEAATQGVDALCEGRIPQLRSAASSMASCGQVEPRLRRAGVRAFVREQSLAALRVAPLLGVEAYLATGSWSGVDALFTAPPESSEQALHFRDKLLDRRDHPVRLTLPELAPPWRPVAPPDTLGELAWRAYFLVHKLYRSGEAAAAGWDGDRASLWTEGQRQVALLATAWDTAEDAAAFAEAYRRTLEARRRLAEVTVRDQLVLIVDGCDRALCPEIVKILDGVKVEGTPGPG